MTSTRSHLALVVEAVGAQLPELADAAHAEPFRAATLDDFVDFARRAENAGIDALFYADFMGKPREQFGRRPLIGFEPLTALAAIAARTTTIGLVATASTTFGQPYTVARQIASLDNLSSGRAGWNVVTSISGAGNYGHDALAEKVDRYERAAEFTDAVVRLWGSWSPEHRHPGDGAFVDTDAIADVTVAGRHIALDGWLDVPSDAQSRPVLFQAGSSEQGIEFAGRFADVVFGVTPTRAGSRRLRTRLRDAAAAHGRDPDTVLFLPGARIFLTPGNSVPADQAAATPPVIESSELIRTEIAGLLGTPVDGIDVDAPIPAGLLRRRAAVDTDAAAISGTANAFWDLADEPGATLRQLYRARRQTSGFLSLTGTAEQIADRMAAWFDDDAADGFVLGAGGPIDDFYDAVLPILRDRGLVRSGYETTTLRGHLDLSKEVR